MQRINPVLMFMINLCHKFIRGLRVSRKHYLDNVKNSSKKKKCIHVAAVVVLLYYTVVLLLFLCFTLDPSCFHLDASFLNLEFTAHFISFVHYL